MQTEARRRLLVALLAATLMIAATTLFEVIATVVFTITVAYLLVPAERRIVERGMPRRMASGIVAVGVVIAALAPIAVLSFILYNRRRELIDLLGALPEEVPVAIGGFEYVIVIGVWLSELQAWLSGVAVIVAQIIPVLALKFSLFAVLLYALLVRNEDAAAAVLSTVPRSYHDIVYAFHDRIRATLFTIYILQVATAAATFVFALPVFYAFGYGFVVTLSFSAAVLQFLPIVGPSILIGGLALYEVTIMEAPIRAVLILVIGLVTIAGLPDILVRPRLASETGGLPGGLYFVGFVGGLLTMGAVGIVVGPLAVALVAEAGSLLAANTRDRDNEVTGGNGA